jgi:TetR/AcrR family transcriptional repressor of mexJK operon
MADSAASLTPTPQDGPPKRRQVLEAASDLFLAHGYGAVSMDAIARAAGVSKATLYAYFASKDELFGTLMRERAACDTLNGELFPVSVSKLRPVLEAIGQRMLRFLLRPTTLAIYRIAIAESARFPELGRTFYASGPRRFQECMREWIMAQQQAGLVRPADPDTATVQFGALLRCDVFLRATLGLMPAPDDAEIDRAVVSAVETWMRAYATPEA